MHVAELWRYPVKSMAGEPLSWADVTPDGVEGLAERMWPGHKLRIGDVVVQPVKLRGRCVMTTFDPDTLAQDLGVLRRIVEQFGGTMALDTAVIVPGRIAVGDQVSLL